MDRDELIATAELGEEARKFLDSDLGRCLVGMAQQEIAAAQDALEKVAPTDTEAITGLQNHAKVARWFEQWLYELVDKGNSALEVWRHEQET